MTVRANPKLIDELEHYGARDVAKCYQCGNCSAACRLSGDAAVFPRKSMHYLQLGLEKPLRSMLEPWLCYYCGDCSEQCPRGAEPGETMMGLRRWLTAQFDFTGISRMLYSSEAAERKAILWGAGITGVCFLLFGFIFGGGSLSVYDGPGAFLPDHYVHIFDWIMGITLASLLTINAGRMWYFTMNAPNAPRIPLAEYVRHLLLLPTHFFTQKRYSDCENKRPWVLHLVLMLSYMTMMMLIMLFLKYMQAGPEINWYVHFFGYLSSIGLIITVMLAIWGRLSKDEASHKHSHESDWYFLGLLLYVVVTGIVQHALHRAGMPVAANLAYIIHMMGVVPMLVLEVPFSKWSHMFYRPLAIYLAQLQRSAR